MTDARPRLLSAKPVITLTILSRFLMMNIAIDENRLPYRPQGGAIETVGEFGIDRFDEYFCTEIDFRVVIFFSNTLGFSAILRQTAYRHLQSNLDDLSTKLKIWKQNIYQLLSNQPSLNGQQLIGMPTSLLFNTSKRIKNGPFVPKSENSVFNV